MTDEERKKRIHDITYSTDDREELAERIVALEELCTVLYQCTDAGKPCETCPLFDGDGGCMDEQRMDELGVPR